LQSRLGGKMNAGPHQGKKVLFRPHRIAARPFELKQSFPGVAVLIPTAELAKWRGESKVAAEKEYPLDLKCRLGIWMLAAGQLLFFGTLGGFLFVWFQRHLESLPFALWPEVFPWRLAGLSLLMGAFLVSVGSKLGAHRRERIALKVQQDLTESAKAYEQKVKAEEQFYFSEAWRRLRVDVIRRDGEICRLCGKAVRVGVDLVVDHIKPRSIFPEQALDPSNLQVLCSRCNSAKGNRRVVVI